MVIGGDTDCSPDSSVRLLLPTPEQLAEEVSQIVPGPEAVAAAEVEVDGSTAGTADSAPHERPISVAFPFLNSGTIMGRAGDMKEVLEEVLQDAAPYYEGRGMHIRDAADQRLMTRYWLAHPGRLQVDMMGELFHTLHGIHRDAFRTTPPQAGGGARLYSDCAGAEVAVPLLHGNGEGFELFSELVQELGMSGGERYEDYWA